MSVDIDATREVAREEKFDPLSQVERSKDPGLQGYLGRVQAKSGSVSVAQNLPNAQQQQSGGNGGKTSSSSTHNNQTVNYELNSTHSERVREPGDAQANLAAAAVVDGIDQRQGRVSATPQGRAGPYRRTGPFGCWI